MSPILDKFVRISEFDNPERVADILFVHGLGGHSLATWHPTGSEENRNSWPFWLSSDLPTVGIWSLGYTAQPSEWKGGTTMPLVDRAINILAQLDVHGIGTRPLLFITHSLGGLLVKQMLRHALDFGQPVWTTLVANTCGIVFLSTPHSGSDLASWLKYLSGILRPTVTISELEAHHSRLRELNHLYRNHKLLSHIPIQVYYETRPTHGVMVVNQTSADPGIPGVIPIPLEEDHISICKPSSPQQLVYMRVKSFIERQLAYTPPDPLRQESMVLAIDTSTIGNKFGDNTVVNGPIIGRDLTR
ncbi:esterase/lipase family protein [Candidatus Competibacter phosphatis]|uniref:esterase/lipase family protein n=1 Tax=Candidatus Competibacter phosphatis TaxID=221280 RepID=UPI001B7DA367|nr:hypothetical protein [Candidatus Competibacter phosphatis]